MSKVKSEEGSASARQKQLLAAVKAERAKAFANHWSYDPNRHMALLKAYQAVLDADKQNYSAKARSSDDAT